MFSRFKRQRDQPASGGSSTSIDIENGKTTLPKSSLGILNDRETSEVPGSVLLLSKVSQYNAPLGSIPARRSSSSLPSSPLPTSRSSIFSHSTKPVEKKRTADGQIILEPQPTDAANDPLNWPVLRRDLSLLSLGFYSMIGGGMTPILAAGFGAVAADLNITVPQVALTTGLYMLGLGVGSVLLSPTAILYGKRPVYLGAAICFIITNIWCALSPNFISLLIARIVMGIAVSSVECLPSASIAEIYFLHEKAFRLGIYTLLLLGGKNLIPLVSAAIIQSLGWRWVFWIVAIVVGFAAVLLFFFVPETFWDRSPKPKRVRKRSSHVKLFRSASRNEITTTDAVTQPATIAQRRAAKHAHFADGSEPAQVQPSPYQATSPDDVMSPSRFYMAETATTQNNENGKVKSDSSNDAEHVNEKVSPVATKVDAKTGQTLAPIDTRDGTVRQDSVVRSQSSQHPDIHSMISPLSYLSKETDYENSGMVSPEGHVYTRQMINAEQQTYRQSLRIYAGRINPDSWIKAAIRPFILFAYPSILWSAMVYALSVGWLIVLSESVSTIYESRATYNFTPLQVGLVYISPFVGGILGTAVAGKLSDIIVKYMARKNEGVYEPEFRLVMTIPIAITTVIGLMGYGWSVEERDAWIVPTIFFGLVSFGCSLGSTTSITFAVDSYRQYSGEALVTLNFSKNILHGLVWSLFFNNWLQADGSRLVFICIGAIQLGCLLLTIPIYIYGKRGRMWTVRKNLMEKF